MPIPIFLAPLPPLIFFLCQELKTSKHKKMNKLYSYERKNSINTLQFLIIRINKFKIFIQLGRQQKKVLYLGLLSLGRIEIF